MFSFPPFFLFTYYEYIQFWNHWQAMVSQRMCWFSERKEALGIWRLSWHSQLGHLIPSLDVTQNVKLRPVRLHFDGLRGKTIMGRFWLRLSEVSVRHGWEGVQITAAHLMANRTKRESACTWWLPFPFVFRLSSQPTAWCWPQSWWVFPLVTLL